MASALGRSGCDVVPYDAKTTPHSLSFTPIKLRAKNSHAESGFASFPNSQEIRNYNHNKWKQCAGKCVRSIAGWRGWEAPEGVLLLAPPCLGHARPPFEKINTYYGSEREHLAQPASLASRGAQRTHYSMATSAKTKSISKRGICIMNWLKFLSHRFCISMAEYFFF